MITLLGLGIITIGITAVRARKISRSVGKLWIDLEIATTILYILFIWFVNFAQARSGYDEGIMNVYKMSAFMMASSTYLLCAYKITVGLSRNREKAPMLSIIPYFVLVIFLLIVNPINRIAYYPETTGVATVEKISFMIISAAVLFYYVVITVYICFRHRRRLGLVASTVIISIVIIDYALVSIQHLIEDFAFVGAVFATFVTFDLIMLYIVDNPTDPKTGIYNSDAFFRAVEENLILNKNTDYELCVLDIRNFQDVNERFGFERGDDILTRVALFMRRQFSWEVELGYLGEDNFVGMFPEGTYWMLQEELSLDEMYPNEKMDYKLSLYAGVYKITDRTMNPILMCDRARFAMQSIRYDYRKHECIYDMKQEHAFEMQAYMLHNCDKALADGDFIPYFQPIYEANTKQICSAEALVRWKDKQYGIISPGDFIPIFERNGFINKLDVYMWEQVCKYISEWRKEGILVPPVSVNISRRDLQMENLYEIIIDLIKKYHLSPLDIKLEITESAFVAENQRFFETVDILKEVGFRILMDDFGSGYSSFNTFKDAHVDILKADMRFMDGIESSEKGKIVIQTIVDMAQKLDIPIVVEGVETKGQYEYVKELGCQMIQGYYFSRPIPPEEFKSKLK